MPRPTSATVIQRPDLGAIAYEYAMAADRQGFIADQVLPYFEVAEQSGDYPIIPMEAILKVRETLRAPRGMYSRDDWEFETGTYSCKEHGLEGPLDDTERALYRRLFDAEEVTVQRTVLQILRARELRVAQMVFNDANIANSGNVTISWDNAATCTPKQDVDDAAEALRDAMGIVANTLVITHKAMKNVLRCDELRDYLQYTSPHLISTRAAQLDMLAKYLDVERILVAGSQYDSADKGQAADLTNIWDDGYALLARLATNARDLREPCLGRTFLWTADSPQMLVTEQYREESRRSWIYRVRHNVGEAFVFTGAAYLLGNIISSES